ncbi:MAG: class I SAM-dependent methyltransferase [Patescibacteria group bacterium]
MGEKISQQKDQKTADAFAASWNNLPAGSVYTRDQFEDWLSPITGNDVFGKDVLELGCGNGSLMIHMTTWNPARLVGVDLGDSVESAKKNLSLTGFPNWGVLKADLISYESDGFDMAYSIGVIHHLKDPKAGFESLIRNTKSGGRFHAWVYAYEGNDFVRLFVDPIRKVTSHMPWWFTKYIVATPLAVPFFLYAKILNFFTNLTVLKKMPLYEYSLWIARREFSFFRHVAFDQLVTPQTKYISRATIEKWLAGSPYIDQNSTYIIMRNGNSWKFGGRKK